MEHLSSVVHHTPLSISTSVNKLAGMNIYFKMENQQKTGAFKVRGASFKIANLSNEQVKYGVITASAGNHAQGVALAAAKRGISAKIYVPEKTPDAKIQATRSYGATIVLKGASFDEACEAALAEQQESKSTFVHPFDDYDVMAGQGTIAFEMLKQQPLLDTILVPVGGGGLISGIAVAAKMVNPKIKIIGVQAKGASAIYNQFHGYKLDTSKGVSTIADGIAVKQPGKLTFPIIKEFVDDIFTVSDTDIAAAMIFMLERKKTLIEGAGAAAFAAVLAHARHLRSAHCGVIVSGGNIDLSRMPQIQSLAGQNLLSCLA